MVSGGALGSRSLGRVGTIDGGLLPRQVAEVPREPETGGTVVPTEREGFLSTRLREAK